MSKDFPAITGSISDALHTLRADIPAVTRAFSGLAQAASARGVLDPKTKELIALALGVAAHCDACIGFHVRALLNAGTTRQELAEALGMAVYMGGGPSLMYAAEAMQAWGQYADIDAAKDAGSGAKACCRTPGTAETLKPMQAA